MSEHPPLTPETIGPFLATFQGRLADLDLPPELNGSFPRAALLARVRSLRRRLREGAAAPVRLALLGPTGAGKSKLFNSLAGSDASPSGFRRPFTRRAVYLVHESRRRLLGEETGDVRLGSDPAFRDLVLVDTPDFDSVEPENRREADRVLADSDAVAFVTDAQKYADHATWEYLRRIFGETKPVVLVLNKAAAEGAVADFSVRLDAAFGERARSAPRIVIPELPLDDAMPIPADEPSLRQLREAIERIVGSEARRRATLRERLERDCEGLLDLWGSASPRLHGYLEGIARLEARLAGRFEDAALEVGTDVEADVDPALRAEVYSRLLERLQRIDVLRYPRKLLAMPFRGLRTLARRWLPERGGRGERGGTDAAASASVARQEPFQALESLLLRLLYDTREDFRAEDACSGILSDADFSSLRLSHGELEDLYRERDRQFRDWLRAEAEGTASRLTGEHKLKFILSQVIFNTAIVGVQIHTAGGFTLAELLTDSVLSPLVAKAVGIAVSSEAVTKFTRRAGEEHGKVLAGIVDVGRLRFARYLEDRRSWNAACDTLSSDFESLKRSRDAIRGGFEVGGHGADTRREEPDAPSA